MSDSREEIAQAIRESQSDDYKEGSDMNDGTGARSTGHVFPDALTPGNATATALRDLYLAIREAVDSGVLDLDEISLGDPTLGDRIVDAMRAAERPLVETFGPQTVK